MEHEVAFRIGDRETRLTYDHPSSSSAQPVLVLHQAAFGPEDLIGDERARDIVAEWFLDTKLHLTAEQQQLVQAFLGMRREG